MHPRTSEHRAITIDHRLFAVLDARPGLQGPELLFAVALAQWAVLSGLGVLVAAWLLGDAADRAAAVVTGAGAALALLIAAATSSVVDAPRPFVDGTAVNYLDHVRDGSFPSDHATLAFALAFGFWKRRPSRWPLVWIPLLAVAAVTGWARVFLGAHYPSDILGGGLVGAASVWAVGTSIGQVALRPLQAFVEGARGHAAAGWRLRRPGRGPGASDR